ncbi:MAG TPA: threonyl-tRNA synthetase editing domain-containing protein [Sedimentisphaerales bacterium]|nr:threonyl-tRNA synthetase editing domain-containing protein [Sedimentisphaerales bacterium]
MILDCYQCSSCYFEDKEPSSRIDPSTISQEQPKKVFRNVLVVFVCIELYDSRDELQEAAEEFGVLSELIGKRPIVLCPNVHLSIDRAPEKQAAWLVGEMEKMLIAEGYEVHCLSFGYHKQYGMDCDGNVGSIVGRRFYGSEEKQFLRLLTRLGVCPPETLPKDMPSWAKTLTERQLRVLGSRRDAYNVARRMLQNQLDATGHGELWTCMLFEGERKPIDDYLSALYEIIEDYHDVRVHRAMNLSMPGYSNAARFLFRKFPEAIESGRLRIYNSKVSDLEFLLTSSSVLLAFPHIPRKAGSHAGEISFGIYCKDEDFAKNLIQWYQTFLVDSRFGWIRTEAELNATINELEEELFQDKRE